jgi:ABC-type multidrug transport system fused ATPase/permease subunit
MKQHSHLYDVFDKNKYWIFFTYFLLIVEFLAFSVLPYLLGKTVDGLILKNYNSFWIYLTIFISATLIGTIRRRLDTRVFSKVWERKSLEVLRSLKNKNIPGTTIISRLNWMSVYGDFFEHTLPTTLHSSIELLVASFMIWLVIPNTSYVLIFMAILGISLSYFVSFRLMKYQKQYQKIREETDAKIVQDKQDETELINANYESMRKNSVKRSDLEAFNWRSIEILSIVGIVIAIFALIESSYSLGSIMSTLMYTDSLFQKSSMMSFYFFHLRQIKMVDEFLD